jgi:hypothetical protein
MNFPPTTIDELAVVLVGMFVLGLGFYGLGRWLRSKGYGDQLDRIDARVAEAQRRSLFMLGPWASAFARRANHRRAR